MSLLLKALQNAAKNREAGAAAPTPTTSDGTTELSLQPMEEKSAGTAPRSEAGPLSRGAGDWPAGSMARDAGASRSQAQNVLQAGASGEARAAGSGGIIAWLLQRPLVLFSTAAGVFAIGYGIYLYLEITNPGIFMARPAPPAPGPALTTPSARTAAPAPHEVAAPAAEAPTTTNQKIAGTGALPAPEAATTPHAPGTVSSTPAVNSAATQPSTQAAATSLAPGAGPVHGAPAREAQPAPPRVAVTPTTVGAPDTARPRTAARPAVARQSAATAAAAAAANASVAQSDLDSAYRALQQGQLNEAERRYREVLSRDAKNIDAMLGLASIQAQDGRMGTAAQLYLRVLEVDPHNSYAQAGLLNIGGRADPAAAETRLKQLIASEPSAYLYFTLGNLYAEQNQWGAAQGAYFQAFNMAPDNPDYAFNLAVGLEHLSQPKLALDYYRRAVSIAQARGSAQFALASAQARIRGLEAVLAGQP